jgi:hypothetical protein
MPGRKGHLGFSNVVAIPSADFVAIEDDVVAILRPGKSWRIVFWFADVQEVRAKTADHGFDHEGDEGRA